MADIINLNKARKGRNKVARDARAKQNRVTFGQTKAEKKATAQALKKQSRGLDGRKLDEPSPDQMGRDE